MAANRSYASCSLALTNRPGRQCGVGETTGPRGPKPPPVAGVSTRQPSGSKAQGPSCRGSICSVVDETSNGEVPLMAQLLETPWPAEGGLVLVVMWNHAGPIGGPGQVLADRSTAGVPCRWPRLTRGVPPRREASAASSPPPTSTNGAHPDLRRTARLETTSDF